MTDDELLAALAAWLDQQRRPAWKPEVADGPGEPTGSRFGGAPWLPEAESWPACTNCARPQQLFLQLDLDALPAELGGRFGSGLLQLFYCTNGEAECDVELEAYLPFEGSLARIVSPDGPGAMAALPAGFAAHPARQITGWSRFEELPQSAEHEELGLRYDYDFEASTVKVSCPAIDFVSPPLNANGEHAEKIGKCEPNDKLAGWPYWVQSTEYPSCPRCGERMGLVFQIDSEDHVPFMFGDAGCGHITQCPDHPDVLGFGWACC